MSVQLSPALAESLEQRFGPSIPTGPFVAWLAEQLDAERHRQQLAGHEGDDLDPTAACALRFGISERTLYRYRHGLDSENRPTETFRRYPVEDVLDRAGVPIGELYLELADRDIDVEPDGWCGRCRENVTPLNGLCPWCDHQVSAPHGGGRRGGYQARYISDDELQDLHRRHVAERLGVGGIAREVWRDYGYSSAEACEKSIAKGWRYLRLQPLPVGVLAQAAADRRGERIPDPLTPHLLGVAVFMHQQGGLPPSQIARQLVSRSTVRSPDWLADWLRRRLREMGAYRPNLTAAQRDLLRLASRRQGVTGAQARDHLTDTLGPSPDQRRGIKAMHRLGARGLAEQRRSRGPWHSTIPTENLVKGSEAGTKEAPR